MEGIVTELLRFAFTGVNVIPTAVLLLMQFFWLIAITGFFDLDFLDFDFDLEGAESVGPLGALAIFINVGQVPVALVLSILILNNWLLVMFTYFLPIKTGGIIAAILLIPALVISISITKAQVILLKKIFPDKRNVNDVNFKVLNKRCQLLYDLEPGRLGQVSIKQLGAAIVLNVETLIEDVSFKKGDTAFIIKKDNERDVYYISKSLLDGEIIN